MSASFDRIRDYIDKYDGDDFVCIESGIPASKDAISTISTSLGLEIPDEYKTYLTSFGTLTIGGIEFFGSSEAGYRDVVAIRDELASQHAFPNDLIPLTNEDGDSYVCIGTDGRLLRWFPNGNAPSPMNESLGTYLLRLCDELIEDEADEDD